MLLLGASAAPRIGRPGGRPPSRPPSNDTPSNPPSDTPSNSPSNSPSTPPSNPPSVPDVPSVPTTQRPSGSISTGGENTTPPTVSGGRLQTTPQTSKVEGVELAIEGISTAVDITNLGISVAQLQQSADLRSCIANMPACCHEIQIGGTDGNYCSQAGVSAGLNTGTACAFTGMADADYVDYAARACAAAFPMGSAS